MSGIRAYKIRDERTKDYEVTIVRNIFGRAWIALWLIFMIRQIFADKYF
jgi:hypothetical protein